MTQGDDLIVLGGGPAGAISALLAARDGLRVRLIDPCNTPPRLEGLSPRLRHWLSGQGLLKGFDKIHGPLRRTVDWAGISDSNSEFVIFRDALDQHLRRAARDAGATLIRDSGSPESGGVILSSGGHLPAAMVIDARGRKAGRAGAQGAATLAFSGWLQGPGLTAGVSLTAIATGWVWRVALADGRIWAQTVMDAAGHGDPAERFLNGVALADPELRQARLEGAVSVRAAQPRLPVAVEDLSVLPVGDALASMDPLSGHGQFWAVSSALAVAAVRRSLAACPGPETEDLCRKFLNRRAVGTGLHQARVGRDFIRSEQRFADQPFWKRRAAFPDSLASSTPKAEIGIDEAIVVEKGLLTRREVLRTPRSPEGVAWFGPVPAVEAWQVYQQGGLHGLNARWGNWARRIEQALAQEGRPSN
ncbi:pilus assembly protein CpaD [Paracoccus seriniphilus]|uniref:Dehydrogenase (Flavoprotein) n=1 Tax=Paracoccus seriniphilus TaxID=184748 RepID=A0A239Q1A3_9RHOB|nr:pilus assembly protein CpaD [Paracoccus seriniphilus]WCR15918.1 pilus assembly protein CpaD [Paracoccus seriniphilus]SNT76341.1 Dehydrogenase (flavoprotein) [Paracoccus seriniphilus]